MINKTKIKKFLKYIAIFVGLILLYILILTLTSLIPTNAIKSNTEKSARELVELGEKTFIDYGEKQIILFNFTDAIMLNTAYSINNKTPLYSAITAKRNYVPRCYNQSI